MKAGKLSGTVLKRSVLRQLHMVRPEVMAGPGVGCDASVLSAAGADIACASTVMPLTGMRMVPVTVYTALNSAACSGISPIGILVNLLLPTTADEQRLRGIMGELEAVCTRENLQVLGGHTEAASGLADPVLSVTAVGAADEGSRVAGIVRPGMELLITKWVGLAGTAILADAQETVLKERFASPLVEQAKRLKGSLSVLPEAAVAAEADAVMHDISQGGVYAALWELGERFGIGMEIDLKKIPIRQETVEICEFFHLNPYKLLSTGSLLIAAESGRMLADRLMAAGISCAVMGRVTDGSDRVIICGEDRRYLERAQTDELYRMNRS